MNIYVVNHPVLGMCIFIKLVLLRKSELGILSKADAKFLGLI